MFFAVIGLVVIIIVVIYFLTSGVDKKEKGKDINKSE
jgi:hypothetical protein